MRAWRRLRRNVIGAHVHISFMRHMRRSERGIECQPSRSDARVELGIMGKQRRLDHGSVRRTGLNAVKRNRGGKIRSRLIKDTGGHVSLAVPIEMAMGHGMPAIQDALDHGIRPSLSSDVDVTMSQDPFTLMRSTFTLQRLPILQRARNGAQILPPLLPCRGVLEFATIEGARCALLENKVGTLTPEKEADIVVLRADLLNVRPINNAPDAVVNLMNPSNVETVFIARKVMKWRGSLAGIDVSRVLRLEQEARDAVLRRAGFKVSLPG
jgi:5-methylthioadenosine/S-adenosylhomocysteine deaminase